MFGALRFLLAYLVILSHLVGTDYVAHFGFYAVRGFFIISGFLMTAALNEVYAFDGLRFWTNRALRLLPPYYLVCLLTLAAIALMPEQAAHFLKFWHSPFDAGDLIANLTILPLQLTYASFRLVPPYWSVAIEIDMYLMLYLVMARRLAWALIALAAGLSFQLIVALQSDRWDLNYFIAPAAVLPFAIGAALYFLRRQGLCNTSPRLTAIACVAWLANMVAGGSLLPESHVFGLGYFIDVICLSIVVSGLASFSEGDCRLWIRRADRTLGEWSYSAFLMQWLAAFVVWATVLPDHPRGWLLLFATTPVVLLCSIGLVALNRALVEPLRNRVRAWRWRQPRALGVT